MFDMTEVGRRIAGFRKEKGMTQMGLADCLGISYQAVSNWERGESMPDIAKLGELSEVLGVSIDVILGNDKKSQVAEALSRGEIPEDINEVIADLLPVMTPEQIGESAKMKQMDGMDIPYLIAIAPFVDKQTLSSLVEEYEGVVDIPHLIALAPFISCEMVSTLAKRYDGDVEPGLLFGLATFLKNGTLDELLERISRPLDKGELIALLPFLKKETIVKFLKV